MLVTYYTYMYLYIRVQYAVVCCRRAIYDKPYSFIISHLSPNADISMGYNLSFFSISLEYPCLVLWNGSGVEMCNYCILVHVRCNLYEYVDCRCIFLLLNYSVKTITCKNPAMSKFHITDSSRKIQSARRENMQNSKVL